MSTPDAARVLKGLERFRIASDLHARHDYAAAADAYRIALQLLPDHPKVLIAYGQLAEEVRDWNGALKIYRRLEQVSPVANLDAKIGLVLFNLERYAEAIPLLEAYAVRKPDEAALWRMLAAAWLKQGDPWQSIRCGQRAWALEKHADAACALMSAWLETGDAERLSVLVDEALRRWPDHWQVRKLAGEYLLKAGDYARGFPYFREMRFQPGGDRHYVESLPVPEWDGQYFEGLLLVGGEQGIGDEILTASMYPDLVAMGQRALIEADPRLLALLTRSFPALAFVARGERALAGAATSEASCRKTIAGDLGQFFRVEDDAFDRSAPWIRADESQQDRFASAYAQRWPGLLRVGISWKSRRELKGGSSKSIGIDCFRPLLVREDCAFVSLQYGAIAEDLALLGPDAARLYVDPAVDATEDIEALFAQVAALDLVISTSNVTAHVAGALGVPCWVVLPRRRPVIWYWGYEGEQSRWYPHTRLLRNEQDDDWQDLFARINDRLGEFMRDHRAASGAAAGANPADEKFRSR